MARQLLTAACCSLLSHSTYSGLCLSVPAWSVHAQPQAFGQSGVWRRWHEKPDKNPALHPFTCIHENGTDSSPDMFLVFRMLSWSGNAQLCIFLSHPSFKESWKPAVLHVMCRDRQNRLGPLQKKDNTRKLVTFGAILPNILRAVVLTKDKLPVTEDGITRRT